MRVAGRVATWLLGVPAALLAVLYLVLLITPVPLPFVNSQVRNLVMTSLPEGSELRLGGMKLALEGYVWPVIQFNPVEYRDRNSGAVVRMAALEVGFSPIRALWGQPGATVTIVEPHIQVNQDLFGPRLARFNIVPDPDGGRPTVQILEGSEAFPAVDISATGVDVRGELPDSALTMRSDNDWLIYNLEAAQEAIAGILEQAELGRFSRLVIRDGTLDMNDALYGLFRTFNDITLDIAPKRDGETVAGTFSADFGGAVINGIVERLAEENGDTRLQAALTNIDFSAILPFINDIDQMIAVEGAGALSVDVRFNAAGKVEGGLFHVDLTGTDLRIEDDYFPIASSIIAVAWDPQAGQFTMAESQISIGESSGWVSGVFKLGLDQRYGPTVSISSTARDIFIHSELGAPEEPFTSMSFSGWSAPLYGALGIDRFTARKADGAHLVSTGRADMLRKGLGFDMTIAGDGISADDLKRLWPYFIAPESRDWFVANVVGGRIKASSMHYDFPAGTLAMRGEEKPLPKDSMMINIVGEGVQIVPMDGMAPITIDGETRLEVHDSRVTMAGDGGTVMTESGPITIANAAFVMDQERPGEQLIEISGDVSASIPALIALARAHQPDMLDPEGLPFDLAALDGQLALALVSTIVLDEAGETKRLDYAINGTVVDFNSSEPLDGHSIGDGQLSFVASQEGYRVAGQAAVDGLPADLVIEGSLEENASPPSVLLSATLDAEDFGRMGFDVSEFIEGEITFVARLMPDDSLQMAVDLENAAVTVADLGLTKQRGVPGALRAEVHQEGTLTTVEGIDLAFGDVALKGDLGFDSEAGLQSAAFTTFALSPGDDAELSLAPIDGGYSVRLRGEQLDLKPMLNRFFGLGEGSGGPQATAVDQTIVLDAELERALGFFRTTAFNVDVDLALRGADIRRASLQAQLGGNRGISVTTNPTPDGKVMSVVFNDLGSLLRLVGIYPNIAGGEGTLVLETDAERQFDTGTFVVRDFAIVDEDNLAQILGNNQQARQLARGNALNFDSAQADFIRRSDRVELTEAILTGDTVGGTARGFIYTDSRQYDLTGTYVPLFGLNNVFQKLPIFGPILGGREGEGLFGVTFAVRGPLDQPEFKINPVSALVPGVFRRIFEYRAKEQPREQ